ncbi:MAG: hypothetical protein V9G09_02805 [Candidatus Nanopelagicales bacterium]
MSAGLPDDPGQDRVVGYLFPTPGLLSGLPLRTPTAAHARAGRFCYDTMTLVGPGTYAAARAAADAALTAVDVVELRGRPPRTPPAARRVTTSTRDAFGGSCYLNNAAIAAQALRSAGHERVAVVDVDALPRQRDAVDLLRPSRTCWWPRCTSIPGAGWFPHYLGFADETGPRRRRGREPQSSAPGGHRRSGVAEPRVEAALDGGRPI